ncbi:dihydropteroate synthase [Paracoccus fistulariae]|uniref:Dihydropteroate synthase n=1 Tax=Paracoccus fistulariae TaxID=658446 RepID=A0ABY7SMU0_9RHOB|nr:dihydropteroate synthase [Paracoccus fistulariae]MDB6180153.1 dihydropteroate synthase [Paracoccus fistulariae]WCR08238.1 dihydropteroate synthase [Paracoccus fistulariae]
MTDRIYYRPIPTDAPDARYRLAGGWTGFSRFERLQRGAAPQITQDAPPEVIATLTAPRAPVAGLDLSRPRLMGIVNATPDSFSDGGSYDPTAQAAHLLRDGADILDIGGESTRPGAVEIPEALEIDRILPVIRALSDRAAISVDTRKSAVARAALQAGAAMINDVSGFDFDARLPALVAEAGVPVCLMHAQGLPENMQDDPRYSDVLLDVYDALEARIDRALQAGIARECIVIDPGIGFGKTLDHNLAILRRISLYHGLGCPILLGVSRKRFIGTLGRAEDAAQRMPGTLAVTLAALDQGVQIHRVHDVGQIDQGLRLWAALKNIEKAEV